MLQSYSVVVNEFGNSFESILNASKLLLADGGFDVVLPEELVSRLVKSTARKPRCPLPSGPWANQASLHPHFICYGTFGNLCTANHSRKVATVC